MPRGSGIKGYVPGVRENGGQYTHAAIWSAMAFAELDDERCAWELFTYVMAADVYAAPPHTGRGGWT
jgi:cyclic beta-1,2-glucan synthetase